MNKTEIVDSIQEIFQDLLDDDDLVLDHNYEKESTKWWDSLFHMTMMQTVAAEFGIEISIDEIVHTKDTDSLIALVEKKLEA